MSNEKENEDKYTVIPGKKYKRGTHPTSLKALVDHQHPPWDSERAKLAGLKSGESRKAKKAAQEALKISTGEWEIYSKEILENLSLTAVDVIRMQMLRALQEENHERATDLAKSLAEFETPKLARVEKTIKEIDAGDLSDIELEDKIKEMMNENQSN